jgi:SAM-dependent methyltransferase
MTENLLAYICCPITRLPFKLKPLQYAQKKYNGQMVQIIETGFLETEAKTIYPIINGIPRLMVEAIYDFADFFEKNMPDFLALKIELENNYKHLLELAAKKNARTKKSFAFEWSYFNYENDKVWDADASAMLNRFLQETDETKQSLKGKLIFDAGCGNGKLNTLIANEGAIILGMDFSKSIERAFAKNENPNALFIQGDVQFPPVHFNQFDIVHSSGVLICTTNTELSFSCISPTVKKGGKLSVWLYQPRANFIHNLFNWLRNYTSKLPFVLQRFLYGYIIYPLSYIVKKAKGNKQTKTEMIIDVLDWFSPEYRWEHTHDEANTWFIKRNFTNVKVTTNEVFGFNITGISL